MNLLIIFISFLCFHLSNGSVEECYYCDPQHEGSACQNFNRSTIQSKRCEIVENEHNTGTIQKVQSRFYPNTNDEDIVFSCVSLFLKSDDANQTGGYRFCVQSPQDKACKTIEGSGLSGTLGQCVACSDKNFCNDQQISAATGIKSFTLFTLITPVLVVLLKLNM